MVVTELTSQTSIVEYHESLLIIITAQCAQLKTDILLQIVVFPPQSIFFLNINMPLWLYISAVIS